MTAPLRDGRKTVIVPLDLIDDPELDARVSRDDGRIEELGRDMVRRGQIDPIHAFVKAERFEVVDGQTRCIALRRQGRTEVEAFVYDSKTLALEGVKYAANVFRTEMSPADEAKTFFELFMNECGRDIERVAALVGKSVNYVDKRLQLINGDDLVFGAVKDRKITLGVAEELNKIPADDYRRYYLEHAIKSGATVSVVAGWVQEWRSMYENRVTVAAPDEPTQGPITTNTYDPHRCEICQKSDPRHIPQPLMVHSHCKLAILDPLLAAYRGENGGS